MTQERSNGMTQKNRIRAVLGICVISAVAFITALSQLSVFPYLKISGCIPDVLCAFLICSSVMYEGKVSCILALVGGFILQASGCGGVSYYPLLYLAAVCFVPMLYRRIFKNGFVALGVGGLCIFTVEALIITVAQSLNGARLGYSLTHTFIPFVLYSMVCLVLSYLYCRLHRLIFGARRIADIED